MPVTTGAAGAVASPVTGVGRVALPLSHCTERVTTDCAASSVAASIIRKLRVLPTPAFSAVTASSGSVTLHWPLPTVAAMGVKAKVALRLAPLPVAVSMLTLGGVT